MTPEEFRRQENIKRINSAFSRRNSDPNLIEGIHARLQRLEESAVTGQGKPIRLLLEVQDSVDQLRQKACKAKEEEAISDAEYEWRKGRAHGLADACYMIDQLINPEGWGLKKT